MPGATHWPASFDDIADTSVATRDWWKRLVAMSPTIDRRTQYISVLPGDLWDWLAEYACVDVSRHLSRHRMHEWTCESLAGALVEALWPGVSPYSDEGADRARALHYIVEHQDAGLLRHLERLLPPEI